MKKIAVFILVAIALIGINPGSKAKAEVYEEVFIDGVENMSPEEAAAYIESFIGVPAGTYALDELTGYNTIKATKTAIGITFGTVCNLGLAEEVGVKQVSIQTREEGSNMYGNVPISGSYYFTDSLSYMGYYNITNPKVGLYYRGKQKHYIIYNGVEYSYFSYTSEIMFTGE